jgi:hypothetical protein
VASQNFFIVELRGDINSKYLFFVCRVKPQGRGLYWNKGPSKAELTMGPNMVKLAARWVCQAPKDLLQNNNNNNIFEHDTHLNDLRSINPKPTF